MKIPLDLKHDAVRKAINATGVNVPRIPNTVKPTVNKVPKIPTAGVVKRASIEAVLTSGGLGLGGLYGARKPMREDDKNVKAVTNTGKYGLIGGGLGYATAKALSHLTPPQIADRLRQL